MSRETFNITEAAGPGDEFDGDVDDVEMPADVRKAAEARIAAAVKKYGDTPVDS